MKKILLFSFLIASGLTAKSQTDAHTFAQTITAADLKRHLTIIASDSLGGRDMGSEGLQKAADYVTKHFQKLGLAPIAKEKDGAASFLQKYPLYNKGYGETYLKNSKKRFDNDQDFFIKGVINVDSAQSLPVVFAGYGIESQRYSDYEKIDVTDKMVIILEGEPRKADGTYLVTASTKTSRWGESDSWQRKITLAKNKGAKYVLMVSAEEDFALALRRQKVMSDRFIRVSLNQYAETTSGNAVFVISNAIASDLLGTSEPDFVAAAKKITETGQPTAGIVSKENVQLLAPRATQIIEGMNVAGFMEGTDKKDEVVVITAHLDHIGITDKGEINNGADDDGSGTVSVLELAEAFAKARAEGKGPRRSILFMTVTGEEKGLFGSEYYTANPLVPLAQTVCDLNIDMIGRVDDAHKNNSKYVYLIGSDKLSSDLHRISEEANAKSVKYDLDYTFNDPADPNRFYYRSDHYNFAKNKIPVIFYFTGVHEDYHRPGDDVEKILFDKQADIVKLVFYTAWELTNRNDRIRVDSNKP